MIKESLKKVLAPLSGVVAGFLALTSSAYAQSVTASSTEIKAVFSTMWNDVLAYFIEILPFLLPFILGVALLMWLWRFLMGFAHRR